VKGVKGLVAEMLAMRQDIKALGKRVAELETENAGLRRENSALRDENAVLRSENMALRKALEESRRAGKRQAAPFSRGTRKQAPKTPGRKAGKAYGSQARREPPAKIDNKITVDCPLICPHCGGRVLLEGKTSQYQTDIPPIVPTTTEFEIHYGRCTRCQRRVQGRESSQTSDATGAVGGVQIGPSTIAIAAHLNKACGMSYARIAEVFDQIFGLRVNRSSLARALLRLGRKAAPTYTNLIERIRGSPVVSPDETGWRIGGDKAWLWTAVTPDTTVYQIEPGRGYAEAVKLLGEDFDGVLCVDGWAPYRGFEYAQIQTCLAHLLRRSKELREAPPTLACAAYFANISAVLKEALALRDRRNAKTISNRGLRIAKGKIEAKMDRLLNEPDFHDESVRFAIHLNRYRDGLFLFLDRPDVDATNYRAEQAIRPAVINRKTSGGNRTSRGARAQAVIMSVQRTVKQRLLSAFDTFTQMLRDPTPRVHLLGR
jgi:transposase